MHSVSARLSTGLTNLGISHYDPGRDFKDLLFSKLVSPEDRPKVEHHDMSCGIIKSSIRVRAGVSLVHDSDMGINYAGLVCRELREGAGPSRFGFSAYWRADNENPALTAFLKMLSERYPSPPLGR